MPATGRLVAKVIPRKAAQFTDSAPGVNTQAAVFLAFLLHDFDAEESALADLKQPGWPGT